MGHLTNGIRPIDGQQKMHGTNVSSVGDSSTFPLFPTNCTLLITSFYVKTSCPTYKLHWKYIHDVHPIDMRHALFICSSSGLTRTSSHCTPFHNLYCPTNHRGHRESPAMTVWLAALKSTCHQNQFLLTAFQTQLTGQL